MRNRYKTVGGKGRTRVQIQGDMCRLCCSRKDCCRVASSSACFGFRYRSVFHHTAANSAAKMRTMETAAVINELTPIVLAECDLDETNSYLRKHERWNNIGDIVGDEKIWSTTVKTWKTDINNFINHNVDGKITEIDLPDVIHRQSKNIWIKHRFNTESLHWPTSPLWSSKYSITASSIYSECWRMEQSRNVFTKWQVSIGWAYM